MQSIRKILFFFIGLIIVLIFVGAKSTNNYAVQYDYISIFQDFNELSITNNTENFRTIRLKRKEFDSDHDLRHMFKYIEKYESEGYEVLYQNSYYNSSNSNAVTHVVMRKKRK